MSTRFDELSDALDALDQMASVFGDGLTASGVGPHFTCSEAESVARVLTLSGNRAAAAVFLAGHAAGDDDPDDLH